MHGKFDTIFKCIFIKIFSTNHGSSITKIRKKKIAKIWTASTRMILNNLVYKIFLQTLAEINFLYHFDISLEFRDTLVHLIPFSILNLHKNPYKVFNFFFSPMFAYRNDDIKSTMVMGEGGASSSWIFFCTFLPFFVPFVPDFVVTLHSFLTLLIQMYPPPFYLIPSSIFPFFNIITFLFMFFCFVPYFVVQLQQY